MAKSQKGNSKGARTEHAVMEHVIQTKLAGTLGNKKGTSICEMVMALHVAWKLWAKSGLSVSWETKSRVGKS